MNELNEYKIDFIELISSTQENIKNLEIIVENWKVIKDRNKALYDKSVKRFEQKSIAPNRAAMDSCQEFLSHSNKEWAHAMELKNRLGETVANIEKMLAPLLEIDNETIEVTN